MKIVQTIPNFGLGGVQKAGQVVAEALHNMGHEVKLVGFGDGPRYDGQCGYHHKEDSESSGLDLIAAFEPDVIHVHSHHFNENFVKAIANEERLDSTLVVSTPVFGRPPNDRSILKRTAVCCVGTYCLHRYVRWMGMSIEKAMRSRVAAVPLTPFQPPEVEMSALDLELVLQLRKKYGIENHSSADIVVGRIGRQHIHKWPPSSFGIVSDLLEKNPHATWLSIGFPPERGRDKLSERFGKRFTNFEQTTDYQMICELLCCFDLHVFVSTYGECFASSICETAGLGVPTIAMSKPYGDNGQAEQVVEGVTGHLVADTRRITSLVQRYSNSPDELLTMKKSTREHALENWHMDVVGTRLQQLYEAWRVETPNGPVRGILETIHSELSDFRNDYIERMSRLHGTGIKHRALSAVVSNWTLHRMARSIGRRFRSD
jgi:hypothetical protein